jgi:uncharacterized membrane protein YesL
MGAALRAIFQALNEVRLNGYTYIWANVAFCVLCLPVVTAPAAYAALCLTAREVRVRPWEADLSFFWQAFRAHLWRAMPWGMAQVIFVVINLSNLSSYAGRPEAGWMVLRALWWAAAFVWWGVLQYTWFIYDEMEQPSLWGATQNALMMVLLNPIFTLTIFAVQMLIFVLSVMMPPTFALLTFGITVAISSAAVQNRLQDYRHTRVEI